jgi:hypothetical protein
VDLNARTNAQIERVSRLIDAARDLGGMGSYGGDLPMEFYSGLSGLRAQALAAIAAIVGDGHDYYREFSNQIAIDYASSARAAAAILSGLKDDLEHGYLGRQSDLIAAEVFSDFLDMAGHLVEGGYYHPAASLIGAVLEDGLRRIANRDGVPVAPRDDLNALSSKLRQKGTFTPLVAKQVTLWAEIRNHADHGEFDSISPENVAEMYRGVVAFLTQRLG